MDYNTHAPHNDLADFVKCYWTLEAPKETKPTKQKIVPDGCMEMIFNDGDLFKQYITDETFVVQPRCFVFGQITTSLAIEPTGVTGIFAVRFLPDGFMPFATLPISAMENRAVPLHELFGDSGTQLEQNILKAVTHTDRIAIIESFLLQQLITPAAIDRVAKLSVEVIMQLNGRLSVEELSNHIQINRRQLERKFASVIGLSPKQLAKIIRLQAALKILANKQFTSLTSLAHESSYYDQAHFIKDFKEFTGLSPKQFYADDLKMSALFTGAE
ncbi:MAG: helix-turn-helix transcriptional regulator [Bacteroidota bacterium]